MPEHGKCPPLEAVPPRGGGSPAIPWAVMMCGPAGVGKSSVARVLEQQGFVRLSVDDAAHDRGWVGVLTREQALEVDAALRQRLDELLAAGRDVVLDYSFSTRQMRNQYRTLLAGRARPVVLQVRTPRAVALERVARRIHGRRDQVTMPPEQAAAYFDAFEFASADEGPLVEVEGVVPLDVNELMDRMTALGV